MPPCQPWIEAEDVADCCDLELGSTNTEALEAAADNASAILYDLSGRRYPGTCESTVRPVSRDVGWCRDWLTRPRLSRVKLAGHATAILDVQIDGETIDPAGYRLDEHRYLTRLADPDTGAARAWPTRQRLDRPIGDEQTFAITYRHGLQPPPAGVSAASALACELYRACPAPGDDPGECRLPERAIRIVRQGVTVETIQVVATMLRRGATGIPDLDAFVSTYGKRGRVAAVWSPDTDRFARPEGITAGS